MNLADVDTLVLLRFQQELLLRVRPRHSSIEMLSDVVPLVLERLAARAAHVFAAPGITRSSVRYSFPRVEAVSDALLEAAQGSGHRGRAVAFDDEGRVRVAESMPLGAYGTIVILTHDHALPRKVALALRPAFSLVGDLCRHAEELESSRARAVHAEAESLLLRRMVDSVNTCLLRIDTAGRVVFVAASWSVLTREHPGGALGTPLASYLAHDPGQARHVETLREVCAGRRQACLLKDLRWRRADGTVVGVDLALETFRGPAGEVIGAVGSLSDASERAASYDATQRLEERLAARQRALVVPADADGPLRHQVPRVESDATGPLALVVEDNPMNALVLRAMLQQFGVHSVEVSSGTEALAALVRHRPTIVFMDIQMPEVDGIEATARIRAYERESSSPAVPIVAVTAHAMKGDAELYLARGMSAYLAKPVVLSDLRAVLVRYVPATAVP
jgi:CheY-like chemotaxis protein/PAS domain-containing protein